MKISKLQIIKLHGHYNYDDIQFSPDVTFLYGLNGCGKTTVLNITEAIITGQIFRLFDYEFERIVLQYVQQDDEKNVNEIVITRNGDSIRVEFDGDKCKIGNNFETAGDTRSTERARDKNRFYFENYPLLSEISKMFNYVYLPLNRSSLGSYKEGSLYYRSVSMRYRRKQTLRLPEDVKSDSAMGQVERLIYQSYNHINSIVTQISDKFSEDVLKSLIDVDYSNYLRFDDNIISIINSELNIDNIRRTKTAYIKLLKELSIIKEQEVTHYAKLFDDLIDICEQREFELDIPTKLKLVDMIRVNKLVSLAEKAEQAKNEVKKPIEQFVRNMNEFINTSEDEKQIQIDQEGLVWFTTKYSEKPIRLQHLSSGEKQLITFFSNLIFNVESNSTEIFIVDEPELSLHLFWQKLFIDKTLEINKDVQLIFATHSPEIIGRRRDKMFKLVKRYVD